MINNKGYATTGMMVLVLLVSMTIMGTFFNPMLNLSSSIQNSKDLTPNYIKNMNGLERMYSVFNENKSHVGDITFEDIDKSYNVSTSTEDYSVVRVDLKDGDKFIVDNETHIAIEFKSTPTEIGDNYYDIQINLNGEKIIENYNLKNNTLIEIEKEYLYNRETGDLNYGEFEILINENMVDVVAEVKYNKLKYREAIVSNDKFSRVLIIKDDSIYFE